MQVVNNTVFSFAPALGRIRFPGYSLTLVVKGVYAMRAGEALDPKPADDQAPPALAAVEGADGPDPYRRPSDLAYHKLVGEIMVKSTCHAPGGKPADSVDVSVEVGDQIRKTLRVVGPRRWQVDANGRPCASEPEPFLAIPIRWEVAYGGGSLARNPVGLGHAAGGPGTGTGAEAILPLVEYPDAAIATPADQPPPAGLEPVPPDWEPRRSLYGTVDEDWLKTRSPWFPADMNWRFFNEAPADQWLPSGFFRGDETVRLTHQHPAEADYRFALPGTRLRCFVRGSAAGSRFFQEVPMNLDTVWADLDAEAATLVWRGAVSVGSPDCREIDAVLIEQEPLAEPALPASHYEDRLRDGLTPLESDAADQAKAEADIDKLLGDAVDSLRKSGVNQEILDALDSSDDPVRMINNLYDAMRKVLGEAGVDLPPDPRD